MARLGEARHYGFMKALANTIIALGIGCYLYYLAILGAIRGLWK
jgi:hypothetical protein